MTAVAKKSVTFLLLAFAVFYLLSAPEDAANAIKRAAEAVGSAFEQLLSFLSTLAS